MTSNLGHLWSIANWLRHHISGQSVPDLGITEEGEVVHFSYRVPMEAVYLAGQWWWCQGQCSLGLKLRPRESRLFPYPLSPYPPCKGARQGGGSLSGVRSFSVSQSGYALESHQKLKKYQFSVPFPRDNSLGRGPRHYIIGMLLKWFLWESLSYIAREKQEKNDFVIE